MIQAASAERKPTRCWATSGRSPAACRRVAIGARIERRPPDRRRQPAALPMHLPAPVWSTGTARLRSRDSWTEQAVNSAAEADAEAGPPPPGRTHVHRCRLLLIARRDGVGDHAYEPACLHQLTERTIRLCGELSIVSVTRTFRPSIIAVISPQLYGQAGGMGAPAIAIEGC
jgi:hypothetical protein